MSSSFLEESPLNIEEEEFLVKIVDSSTQSSIHETSVKLKDPYDFDLSSFIPNNNHTDLNSFFELACSVINNAQARSGVPEEKRIKLVEDFNSDLFLKHGHEVITWKLVFRKPGNMNTKATGRPQRKGNYSYDLISITNPNKVIVVDSAPIDHEIEFSCWSLDASKANRRALWLERLLINESWVFIKNGTERFYWTGRGMDHIMVANSEKLHCRPNRFFVRLREFHSVQYPMFKHFNFETKV